MYIEEKPCIENIYLVLCALNYKTRNELLKAGGSRYAHRILNELLQNNDIEHCCLIRLKENDVPVGIFGIKELSDTVGAVYFLSTVAFYKGNIITFLRGAKKQINDWAKKYKLLLDSCDMENQKVVKWLTLLGFKPSEHITERGFRTFYMGDLNEYFG